MWPRSDNCKCAAKLLKYLSNINVIKMKYFTSKGFVWQKRLWIPDLDHNPNFMYYWVSIKRWCGCSPVPWVGGFHLAVFPFLTAVSCTLPWLSASPRRPCCRLWLLTSRRPSTRSERTQLWLIPARSDPNRDSLQYQNTHWVIIMTTNTNSPSFHCLTAFQTHSAV